MLWGRRSSCQLESLEFLPVVDICLLFGGSRSESGDGWSSDGGVWSLETVSGNLWRLWSDLVVGRNATGRSTHWPVCNNYNEWESGWRQISNSSIAANHRSAPLSLDQWELRRCLMKNHSKYLLTEDTIIDFDQIIALIQSLNQGISIYQRSQWDKWSCLMLKARVKGTMNEMNGLGARPDTTQMCHLSGFERRD